MANPYKDWEAYPLADSPPDNEKPLNAVEGNSRIDPAFLGPDPGVPKDFPRFA